ncbi:MAG: hypothetical protein ACREJV_01150 [Candidatus Rokuibacteriota bacterium]
MMVDETFVVVEGRNQAWPVAWSAVWVGALAAVAIGLMIGLLGYAFGAHQVAQAPFDWGTVRWAGVIFSIGGAFFAYVAGGWVAVKIAGFRRSEPAMLHGAIAWLVTVPFLMLLGALGAGSYFGGWYGGLAGGAIPADPAVAAAFRNSAVATAIAMLLGLIGSALGGWMGSGEPMSLSYYRQREAEGMPERPRRAA